MNAETFNSLYPVGTPVLAYPDVRPEGRPDATRLVTRTRSVAQVLGGHTDVVWVDGYGSCIALTHVDVVSEDEWAKAQLADTVAEQPSGTSKSSATNATGSKEPPGSPATPGARSDGDSPPTTSLAAADGSTRANANTSTAMTMPANQCTPRRDNRDGRCGSNTRR